MERAFRRGARVGEDLPSQGKNPDGGKFEATIGGYSNRIAANWWQQ